MLTLILLPSLFVLFLSFALFARWKDAKCNYYSDWEHWGIVSLIAAVVVAVFMVVVPLTLINRNSRFEYTAEEYNNMKSLVEQYNNCPDSSAFRIVSLEQDIREDVLDMNNTISEHKVMSKSPWVGPWYSEKVGRLEKLKLNE